MSSTSAPRRVGLPNFAVEIRHPRVENWPLMDSPFPTLFMVGAYLYFVVFLGPKMMENRKPFKLNSVLIVYNAAQTLFSLIMFSEHHIMDSPNFCPKRGVCVHGPCPTGKATLRYASSRKPIGTRMVNGYEDVHISVLLEKEIRINCD
ncbi:unnamed protein product [Nezara viridula]|uniref:Elongation of very long chain fatty acids protein n=1 Tax=Nezara viridula TaxID=85310 RepID=A0A9P0ML47_NEZVI|nr:unnamed protein product [Nezara viridula]